VITMVVLHLLEQVLPLAVMALVLHELGVDVRGLVQAQLVPVREETMADRTESGDHLCRDRRTSHIPLKSAQRKQILGQRRVSKVEIVVTETVTCFTFLNKCFFCTCTW